MVYLLLYIHALSLSKAGLSFCEQPVELQGGRKGGHRSREKEFGNVCQRMDQEKESSRQRKEEGFAKLVVVGKKKKGWLLNCKHLPLPAFFEGGPEVGNGETFSSLFSAKEWMRKTSSVYLSCYYSLYSFTLVVCKRGL